MCIFGVVSMCLGIKVGDCFSEYTYSGISQPLIVDAWWCVVGVLYAVIAKTLVTLIPTSPYVEVV